MINLGGTIIDDEFVDLGDKQVKFCKNKIQGHWGYEFYFHVKKDNVDYMHPIRPDKDNMFIPCSHEINEFYEKVIK